MQTNINNRIASLTALASGIKKNQPKAAFVLSGAKVTAPQILTMISSIIAALNAVPPARGAYLKAARSADALIKQSGSTFVALKRYLQNQSGADTALLSDYGLSPRKQGGAKSPQAKVAGAEAAKATRAARHTMGKKQKAKITGVTALASTPPASSPTEAVNGGALQGALPTTLPGH